MTIQQSADSFFDQESTLSVIARDHAHVSPGGSPAHTEAIIPGYEILEVLGRGGMGVVYMARQVRLARLVALKMILGGTQVGIADKVRFQREAQAIARLRHPNIVEIYEFSEEKGVPYFSMELVTGGTLADKLDGTPQAPYKAAELMEQVARAIQHAHERNVIHRDLKPGNILLDVDGRPKISDFGLAKQVDNRDDLTQSGVIMGTVAYMAPEQAAGRSKDAGPAADIYALGAILYDELTGRPPFRGRTLFNTLMQITTIDPMPPTRLQAGIPRDLEAVCLKCLQKRPRDRYCTAKELAEDLRRFLAGERTRHACPIGLLSRTAHRISRAIRIFADGFAELLG